MCVCACEREMCVCVWVRANYMNTCCCFIVVDNELYNTVGIYTRGKREDIGKRGGQ